MALSPSLSSVVHVAGGGVISSIGNSYAQCFQSLCEGKHGIHPLTSLESIHKYKLPVGQVSIIDNELAAELELKRPVTRTAMLGLYAAKEALRASGLKNLQPWRKGLVSSTTVGGMDRSEIFYPAYLQNPAGGHLSDVIHHGCGATTELIAQHIGLNDFTATINTACSSSANAIIYGSRLIRQGILDVVVAGGTDALTKFTINGFKSLMILDEEPCRPFDAGRKGLNLGEGAGYIVLVSEKVLLEEGLNSKAVVSGFANTNDAYHQTASSPDGKGSYEAMEKALSMAGLMPSEISYINLHGTGTVNNDLSEGIAIKRLFVDNLPPLSSTKTFTGHTLGACGGIEAIFSTMAITHQCVFPNLRFHLPIPELDIQPQLNFQKLPVRHVMSNSFGFGGSCSSIIFSTPPE
ncbi:MAG: beta-ketoacyl-[acyl-carrier-protein] synthase family protein [Cyclobacteriaceae bacterium]|nr:beta-ketoacyl-[acyl-carrier-protein] synthase family protein [Cyclobacteriaceae bacterium]